MYRYGDATCVILPQSSCPKFELLDMDILPRRHREAAEFADDSPIAQGLIGESENRTRRLFRSFNELEREACGASLESNVPISHSKIDTDPRWILIDDFGDEWWEHWKKALDRARRVQVPENLLAKQFREARRIGLQWNPLFDPLDEGGEMIHDERDWGHYQLRRGSRHKWGQYLRSNMDWDWDVGTCLNQLFNAEQQISGGPRLTAQIPPKSCAVIDVDVKQGDTWKLEAQESLPKEVRIAYKTETGETQYMLFVPVSSGPGLHPSSQCSGDRSLTEETLGPAVVEPDSGRRTGFSVAKQGCEDRETCVPSSDTLQHRAREDHPVEVSTDDFKGKDDVFNEVQLGHGEDMISVCSLD